MNATSETQGDKIPRGEDPRMHGLTRGLELGALVVLLLLVFAAAARQISAVDYWWQLATGGHVLANGWPSTDVFSYTSLDHAWIELRWLYCVGLAMLVDSLGAGAAVFLKILVVGATLALAVGCAVRRPTFVTGLVLAFAAIMAMSGRMYVRPELVSGFLLVLFVAVIHREREARDAGAEAGRLRLVYFLPLVQLIWVNAHTLFVLGPAVVGAWFVAEAVARFTGYGDRNDAGERTNQRLITSGIVLAGTFVACLFNPWFFEGATFPLLLFQQLSDTVYSTEIGELRGPFDVLAAGPVLTSYVVLLVAVIVAGIASLMRPDLFLLICTGAFAYLSISSVRNIPLFVTVAIPFLLVSLRDLRFLWADNGATWRRYAHHAACVVLMLAGLGASWLMVTDRYSRAANARFGFGVNPYSHPIGAVDFLEENGVIGERVFNYLNEGAYLLYRGYPVYFDPRLEVYGEDHLLEYQRLGSDTATFSAFAEKNDVSVVMLGLGPSQFGFKARLEATGRWRLVYVDHRVFILLRDGLAPQIPPADFDSDAAQWLERYRRVLPAASESTARLPIDPYIQLGAALLNFGAPDLAETFYRDGEAIDASSFRVQSGLGSVAMARRDFETAVDHLRQALGAAPEGARSGIERNYRVAAGQVHLALKEYRKALDEFERAYAITPDASIAKVIEQLRRASGSP